MCNRSFKTFIGFKNLIRLLYVEYKEKIIKWTKIHSSVDQNALHTAKKRQSTINSKLLSNACQNSLFVNRLIDSVKACSSVLIENLRFFSFSFTKDAT